MRMKNIVPLAMVLLLGNAGYGLTTYHLKESLETLPSSALIDNPAGVKVVAGRHLPKMNGVNKDIISDALLIRDASLSWDLSAIPGDAFFECFFKPEGWAALSPNNVTIVRFRVGTTEYELTKPAGTSELQLRQSGTVLQSYPIYNWTAQPWTEQNPDAEWHYLNVGVTENRIHFTVDAFAAREIQEHKPAGRLNRLQLLGGPGTVYSWLHVASASWFKPEELRARFRSLYMGKPDLHPNTVTAPKLTNAPKIDGRIEPQEWAGAACLTGFTSGKNGLRAEDIHGYIGYDEKYIYMAIRTPFAGKLRAKAHKERDLPIYGEESYEIFLYPPFTGVPIYVQLVGNPYGAQCDLKIMDASWNGKWDWKTSVHDGEWICELRASFEGIDAAPAGDKSIWTMNICNGRADALWSKTQRYHDTGAFGILRFETGAPVIRPGQIKVVGSEILIPLEILGGSQAQELSVALQLYGLKDVLPAKEEARIVKVAPGSKENFELRLPVGEIKTGKLALFVREGENELFFHSVDFPAVPMIVRDGFREENSEQQARVSAAETDKDKELTPAEKAAKQKWTPEELGKTLDESTKWLHNTLGLANDVPKPWTPMEVDGQTVKCWGRSYIYQNSLLPVQIESVGCKLFTGPARFVLKQGTKTHIFDKASVEIERVSEALVRVHTAARSGPFLLELTADYEFDGMAKIESKLICPEVMATVDRCYLEFPLAPTQSRLYHLTSSRSGHAPSTDSDEVAESGMSLDAFREVIWLGSINRGFCWFAEGMENWKIMNEKNIQTIEPVRDGTRLFRIKLAEKPFQVEQPWKLVFGIQATPMKPRAANARFLSDFRTSTDWRWEWGDGEYYPFMSEHMDKARERVAKMRAEGKESMPCSSLVYYGKYSNHFATFGELTHPGMIHPELLIWGWQWKFSGEHLKFSGIPERQTAPDGWYGKKWAPRGLEGLNPASDWQDLYIYKLHKLIQDTDLGAIYLDQSIRGSKHDEQGCGYVDYKGEWAPSCPIFGYRKMIQRINRIFYDAHGKTFIRWHSSNQLPPPIVSFIDVFMDGENYAHGSHKVFEFYSKVLSPGRMQAQHTGLPFGWAPDLMPNMELRYAPSPASTRDLMGWFMVHDSTVMPIKCSHNALNAFLQKKRLSYPLNEMKILYYWDNDPRLKIAPGTIKSIFHYKADMGLLILFNRSDEPTVVNVQLDLLALNMEQKGVMAKDAITGELLSKDAAVLQVPVLPRDFRMIEIKQ